MERPAKTATRRKTTASAPRSAASRKKKSATADARPAAAAVATATAVATEPTHEQIAARAHELYERSGHQHGRHDEFWLEAERQLRDELNR